MCKTLAIHLPHTHAFVSGGGGKTIIAIDRTLNYRLMIYNSTVPTNFIWAIIRI